MGNLMRSARNAEGVGSNAREISWPEAPFKSAGLGLTISAIPDCSLGRKAPRSIATARTSHLVLLGETAATKRCEPLRAFNSARRLTQGSNVTSNASARDII